MSSLGLPVVERRRFTVQKMKRKEMEDSSEFYLTRKMRRLDLGLPPIIEKEENLKAPLEEQPPVPESEEKALVLYKPFPLVDYDASNPYFKLHCDLVSGYRSSMWDLYCSYLKDDSSSSDTDKTPTAGTSSMAVVPWVPSTNQREGTSGMEDTTIPGKSFEDERMDVEGGLSMDVDPSPPATLRRQGNVHGLQWQQYYMDKHVPPSIPLTWWHW